MVCQWDWDCLYAIFLEELATGFFWLSIALITVGTQVFIGTLGILSVRLRKPEIFSQSHIKKLYECLPIAGTTAPPCFMCTVMTNLSKLKMWTGSVDARFFVQHDEALTIKDNCSHCRANGKHRFGQSVKQLPRPLRALGDDFSLEGAFKTPFVLQETFAVQFLVSQQQICYGIACWPGSLIWYASCFIPSLWYFLSCCLLLSSWWCSCRTQWQYFQSPRYS